MKVVVYLDDDKLDLKYFDEINNLEKGLAAAGHDIVKLDYRALQRANISCVDKKSPEYMSDAYILTPGGIASKDKFMQHLNLKKEKLHSKPVILYDFDEDFTAINQHMLQWCEDNELQPGKIRNWVMVVTSVKEVVNLLA